MVCVLMGLLRKGDVVLYSSDITPDLKSFLCVEMKRLGVTSVSFQASSSRDALLSQHGQDLDRARMVLVETFSPSSLALADVPMLAELCRQRQSLLVVDNTWAFGWALQPLKEGADVSFASLGPLAGDQEWDLGMVTSRRELWPRIVSSCKRLGLVASPEQAYQTLRGLRTLPLRMRQQDLTTRAVMEWMLGVKQVSRVFHPMLEGGAAEKGYTGFPPILSFYLSSENSEEEKVEALVESLKRFRLGWDGSIGGELSFVWPVGLVSDWRREQNFRRPDESGDGTWDVVGSS